MWAEAMRPRTLCNLAAANSHVALRPRHQAPRCAPLGQEPCTFSTWSLSGPFKARSSGVMIAAAGPNTHRTALDAPIPTFNFSGPAFSTLCAILTSLTIAPAALAAEGIIYNPQEGAETLKTLAGVAYIILVIVYFVRLFKKRADRATSVRLSSSDSSDKEDDEEEEEEESPPVEDNVSPTQCLL